MYGLGVWRHDGVDEHVEILAPGQSFTYQYTWCDAPGYVPNYVWGMSYSESGVINDGQGGFSNVVSGVGSTNTFNGTTNGWIPPTIQNTNTLDTGNVPIPNAGGAKATDLTNALPIIWNNGDTTAARDPTLRSGFNALDGQIQVGNALLQKIANNTQGSGGSNSVSVSITNIFNGQTNAMTLNEYTNFTSGLTNSLGHAGHLNGTNLASAAGSLIASLHAGDAFSTPSMGVEGEDFDVSLSMPPVVGYGDQFRIRSSTIPGGSWIAMARMLIKWLTYFIMLTMMFKWIEGRFDRWLNQRQMQGTTEEILGTNISLVAGAAYAVAFAAILGSLPTVFVIFFLDGGSNLSGVSSGFASVSSTFGWQAATMVFPIVTLITATLNYLVFRYVIGLPLSILIMFIILAFVA